MLSHVADPLPAAPLDADTRDAVSAACERALLSHRQMPTPEDVATVTALITTHGAALAAALRAKGPDARSDSAAIALRNWDALSKGPGAGAFGTWVHLRALARVCRSLLHHTETVPDAISEWFGR
ncbi:DUF6415 family natural product biosynthesis protein [Streptomyces sp. NPDC014733]|uniref:DUF6415 family natural product biosynthesis protein n=1 Tax=Streptomyces sp. NPDC014733 TaxID=3364885 RepID=UPI0036FF4220